MYTVTTTGSTADGRTGTGTATVEVDTHDVSVAGLSVPASGRAGQTKPIKVSVANTRQAENVRVTPLPGQRDRRLRPADRPGGPARRRLADRQGRAPVRLHLHHAGRRPGQGDVPRGRRAGELEPPRGEAGRQRGPCHHGLGPARRRGQRADRLGEAAVRDKTSHVSIPPSKCTSVAGSANFAGHEGERATVTPSNAAPYPARRHHLIQPPERGVRGLTAWP